MIQNDFFFLNLQYHFKGMIILRWNSMQLYYLLKMYPAIGFYP